MHKKVFFLKKTKRIRTTTLCKIKRVFVLTYKLIKLAYKSKNKLECLFITFYELIS